MFLARWIKKAPTKLQSSLQGFISYACSQLFINSSGKNGTIDLQQGDYFPFVIPDILMCDQIHNKTDVEIKNALGEAVATYSIDDNDDNEEGIKDNLYGLC